MTDATLPFVPPLEAGGEAISTKATPCCRGYDHRPQAHRDPLRAVDHGVLLHRRRRHRLVRLELISPTGLFLTSDEYNRLFTLHGIIMVWFFLVPSIPATIGNFLLPLMIGAPDVAFPRLNLMSWYLMSIGAAFTVYVLLIAAASTPAGPSIRRSRPNTPTPT